MLRSIYSGKMASYFEAMLHGTKVSYNRLG